MTLIASRPHPAPRRYRAAIGRFVVAVVALGLVGGCAEHVPGIAAGAPSVSSTGPASPEPAASSGAGSTRSGADAAPVTGGCRVKVAGGSIRMSGGGRVRSVNQAHEFACRNGPLVAIAAVDAAGVRFRLDGADVQVGASTTAQVGPYRITILDLDAPAAEFDVAPAS